MLLPYLELYSSLSVKYTLQEGVGEGRVRIILKVNFLGCITNMRFREARVQLISMVCVQNCLEMVVEVDRKNKVERRFCCCGGYGRDQEEMERERDALESSWMSYFILLCYAA